MYRGMGKPVWCLPRYSKCRALTPGSPAPFRSFDYLHAFVHATSGAFL